MRLFKQQDGLVSLISVSITAFLTLILTIAIAVFMNGELQRSIDYSDNIKAYYNAQSSAEEAIYGIKNELKNNPTANLANLINQGCNNDFLAGRDGFGELIPGGSIHCRQVSANAAEAQDTLDNNQVIQYDLTNAPTQSNSRVSQLSLSWDMKFPPTPPGSFPNVSNSAINGPESAWDPTTPPIMELTIANYFPGQQTNVDQTTNQCAFGVSAGNCSSGSIFLFPQSSCSGACNFVDFQAAAKNTAAGTNGATPIYDVECNGVSTGNNYRCSVLIGNVAPAGYKTIVRLQPRFGDASYDLKAFDDSGTQLFLPLQNAQIDVSAGVGDALRRFTVEVPIRSSVYPGFSVLSGDSSLCKDFDVVTDGSGTYTAQVPTGGCPIGP